ncbi:LptA/OstA family protein [Sphingomonas sp. BIUV-7]|uniref:LptA/OstA family protein n=1 Tax=Sphingomonas natans TaxID=3063330 RepID=A0ABT8Y4M3_9SPHN|nr:LptA/OstA family protein [Sphingomonas sp. BIUV-7]MDO6413270.1 LptA/OstA family protein [Sphingomonas sp. BIUV-7]
MIRGLLLVASPLLATAAAAQGVSLLRGHDSNAPVDVTSDRIEVQDRADRAIFVGNVHTVQGDLTMDAARMTVAYAKGTGPNADPQIQRIDASGGVTVVSPSERAKGSFGIYDLNRRIITLIGGVSLVRAGNTVNGARLVIDLNSGRSTVDGSAVGGGVTGAKGGRVTGRFTVPQRTQAAPTPAPTK